MVRCGKKKRYLDFLFLAPDAGGEGGMRNASASITPLPHGEIRVVVLHLHVVDVDTYLARKGKRTISRIK